MSNGNFPASNTETLSENQRRLCFEKLTKLLPPLELLPRDYDPVEDESLSLTYRLDDDPVLLFATPSLDRKSYQDVTIISTRKVQDADDGTYYVTSTRRWEIDHNQTPKDEATAYSLQYRVNDQRGVPMTDILDAGVLYDEVTRQQLREIVELWERNSEGPLTRHYSELMDLLNQLGPENFVPENDPVLV